VRRKELLSANKLVEEQRLTQRVHMDIEMMRELGYCNGIENYSRYLSGRKAGQPPPLSSAEGSLKPNSTSVVLRALSPLYIPPI
jgi:hypothetical protein